MQRNILCVLLLLGTAGDTKIHKTVPALRLLVILLEEKACTCNESGEKVGLDPESQKVVPAATVPALDPAHLASVALPAGMFDPRGIWEMVAAGPQLDCVPFYRSLLSLGLFPRAASCKRTFLCVLFFPLTMTEPLSIRQFLFLQ